MRFDLSRAASHARIVCKLLPDLKNMTEHQGSLQLTGAAWHTRQRNVPHLSNLLSLVAG